MDKLKLISLTGLQQFLTNILNIINPQIEELDKKIEKKVWKGTQAELEKALADGVIDESTLIVVTDDDLEEQIIEFCSKQDIYDLFGLKA